MNASAPTRAFRILRFYGDPRRRRGWPPALPIPCTVSVLTEQPTDAVECLGHRGTHCLGQHLNHKSVKVRLPYSKLLPVDGLWNLVSVTVKDRQSEQGHVTSLGLQVCTVTPVRQRRPNLEERRLSGGD